MILARVKKTSKPFSGNYSSILQSQYNLYIKYILLPKHPILVPSQYLRICSIIPVDNKQGNCI